MNFSDEYIDWGLSPRNIDFVNTKRFDELKDIKSEFEETEDIDENRKLAFSTIVDENLFNAFT